MSGKNRQGARRPATKLPHLQKKQLKQQADAARRTQSKGK